MKKRLLGLLLAALLVATMITPAAMAVTTKYVVTKTGIPLNVRSSPQVRKDNVIGSFKYGEAVGVDHDLGNGWAEVVFGSKVGYVSTRYLSSTKPADKKGGSSSSSSKTTDSAKILSDMNAEFKSARKVAGYTIYVSPARVTTWINLRWAPSTSARVISTYKAGDHFVVISELNHWLQVQDPSTGYVGYIWRDMTVVAGY